MIKLVFQTLLTGLSIWKSKESRKYIDKVIQLKKDWYYEYSKNEVDDNVLDTIERELYIISDTFSNQVRTQDSSSK